MADCGLPSFKPNDTTGFEIETIDYDDEDIAAGRLLQPSNGGPEARGGPQGGQNGGENKPPKKDFATDKKPPKPPKNMKLKDEKAPKDMTQKDGPNERGPQKAKFNPNEGDERKFKGGQRGANDTICKKRY